MKKSIFFRIFAGYLCIALALSGAILAFSFSRIKDYYIGDLTKNLKNMALTLRPQAAPLLERRRYGELDALVKTLGDQTGTRITVIDPGGIVRADSKENPEALENHRGRPEVIEALRLRTGTSLRYSTTERDTMLYLAVPVLARDGTLLGIVRGSLFLRDIDAVLDNLQSSILSITGFVLGVSLLGALLFSRYLARPVRALNAAAQRVASGDFDIRVSSGSADEFSELSESFNHMTAKIKTLFEEVSAQKNELDSIISSMQDGLLVIDRKERVLIANPAFRAMVRQEAFEGKCYWEVLRDSRFGDLLKELTPERPNLSGELPLNEREYLCSLSRLAASGETVAVFHDVTEIRKLEKVKKDFAANVSHELRTPLTAIKGFAETIEESPAPEIRRYAEIIRKNTDRMISIVEDLLLLSELEEVGSRLNREEVDLSVPAGNALRVFSQKAADKGIALSLEAGGGPLIVQGDPFKLEQVFINLLDNGIKYTERGRVTVQLAREEDAVLVRVRDTGIGIPADHLERIFERFYVVDKSRSRKLGGTGLGLSIVKHIVLLHGGSIRVESTPGNGTTFTVTLPLHDPSPARA